MKTQPPLERLREADPHPDGLPAPPIELVLQRLGEDPAVGVRPPRRVRVGAVAGAAVAVAIVVAVAAVVGLARQRRSGPTAGTGPSPPPYAATSLAGQFSILRRHPRPGPPIMSAVARAIGLRPGGGAVVVRQLPAVDPRPGVTDHLLVVLRRRHGVTPERLSLATVSMPGEGVFAHRVMTSTYLSDDPMPSVGLGVIDSLVPDWVIRVTWQLAARPGGPLRTIHPRIVDNVAYALVPSVAPGSLKATWSGHGRSVAAGEGHEVPACRAAQLTAKVRGGNAGEAALTISASGSTTCQLFGYPRLVLRGRGGASKVVRLRPAGSSTASYLVQGSVHGAPGTSAVFALRPCRPLRPPLRLVVHLPRRGGTLSVPVAPGQGVTCVVALRP